MHFEVNFQKLVWKFIFFFENRQIRKPKLRGAPRKKFGNFSFSGLKWSRKNTKKYYFLKYLGILNSTDKVYPVWIYLFTQKLTIISPKIYPKNGFEEDNSFETVVSFNPEKHCLLKLGKVAYRTLKIWVQCSSVLSIHWLEILLKNFNRQ